MPTEREKLNEAKTRLWHACRKWVKENEVSGPESIYQVDSINAALPALAEAVCEQVGYIAEDDEES